MIDKQDLKTLITTFNIKDLETILNKYSSKEINDSLEEIEITPYKHASLKKIETLIKYNIDVNLSLSNGLTPAFFETEIENFMLLFNNGLSLEETDYMGLNLFSTQSITSILDFIIKNSNVRPNFDDEMGVYYLPNDLELLKFYFENGLIKEDQILRDGQNLSFYLDLFGNNIETIKYLFDKNVDFNKKDNKGNRGLNIINNIEGFEYICNKTGLDFKNKSVLEIQETHYSIQKFLLRDRTNELSINEVINYLSDEEEVIKKYIKENPKIIYDKIDKYKRLYSKDFIEKYQNKEKRLNQLVLDLYLNDSEGPKFLERMKKEFNIDFDRGMVTNHAFDINIRLYPIAMSLSQEEEKMFADGYPDIDFNDLYYSNNKTDKYLINLFKECNYISKEEESLLLSEMDNLSIAKYGQRPEEFDKEEEFYNPEPTKIIEGITEANEEIIRDKILSYLNENKDMRSIISIDLDDSFFWGFFDFSNDSKEYLKNFDWTASGVDPIGFYKSNGKQMYVGYSQDGDFYNIASYFQDIPLYYIYHYKCYELNRFPFDEDVVKAFNKYKTWCNENDILLDKYNVYLDKDKNLFDKPTSFD